MRRPHPQPCALLAGSLTSAARIGHDAAEFRYAKINGGCNDPIVIGRAMKQPKPRFRGRILSPAELTQIRRSIGDFASTEVVDEEMRELIKQQWPDLVAKLPPRRTN